MSPPYHRIRAGFSAAGICLALTFPAACNEPTTPEIRWADDPVQPIGRRVVGLASAFNTTCAHTDAGLLFCWGENRFGEFGNGSLDPSPTPVLAAGAMQLERVFGSMGTPRICGITTDDRAHCWGYNRNGELGDGTREHRLSPTPVLGNLRFRTISTSYHTCGIAVSGQAYCWGSSLGGQLGGGENSESTLVPAPVASSEVYTALTNGMQFTCALRTTGEADCWGWGVGLGSGPGDRSVYYPTPVSGGRRYTCLSAGPEWVCALDTGGTPYCWGKAGRGWPEDFRPTPETVLTQLRFRETTSGSRYGACALTVEGEAYCWGEREEPIPVPGRHRWAGIAANSDGYCGYTPGGSAYCWKWRRVDVNGSSRWVLTEPEQIPALPS